jgi:hypothetical protein
MATVVTVSQLQSVATAQKGYIDKKVSEASAAATEALGNAKNEIKEKIPTEATAAEIKSIEDLFAIDGE